MISFTDCAAASDNVDKCDVIDDVTGDDVTAYDDIVAGHVTNGDVVKEKKDHQQKKCEPCSS